MRPSDRENWYIVSITAHRTLTENDVRTIHSVMKHIVELPHVDAIYFGGARGGDTEALKAALHFRLFDRPRLVVVVPDTLAKQPSETHVWTKKADEVIELKHPITRDDGWASFGLRDQYLVDVASSLVGFYSGKRNTGTGKTIAMAEASGIVVTKIPIQSSNLV